MRIRAAFVASVALGLASVVSASAADWGSLTGVFKYDGAAPKAAPITATKDPEFCGKHELVDETLVVDAKTKAIQNVIVFLYLKPGEKKPAIHPDLAAAAKNPIRFTNANCRFEPHVVAAMAGQTVVLGNNDPVGHNTKVDTFVNPPINPIIPAKSDLNQVFASEEKLPAKVSCSIHPWMTGWLVVKDHPYVGISGADGKFEIPNLPAGEWTFQVWQEKAGFVDKVKVKGKDPKWSKGRFTIKIQAGKATDLGDVMVDPSVFK